MKNAAAGNNVTPTATGVPLATMDFGQSPPSGQARVAGAAGAAGVSVPPLLLPNGKPMFKNGDPRQVMLNPFMKLAFQPSHTPEIIAGMA